jgi:dUTP pyrophosphatase
MKLFQTEQAQELIANGLCDPSKPEEVVTTFLPTRATSGSAGYDIRACIFKPVTINAGETVKIPTGFHLQTEDPSIVGSVHVRSSIGIKKGLILANATGIIDADYPDQWFVFLHNLRTTAVTIVPGERIAQVVFTPVVHLAELQEHSFEKERTGGLGSTDKLTAMINTAYEEGDIE